MFVKNQIIISFIKSESAGELNIGKIKKKIITLLVILNALFSTGMSFAFWASSISSSDAISNAQVSIGTWAIPIYTANEFYLFATNNSSKATDNYYLANDIDFSGYPWNYDTTNYKIVFRGNLNGNNKTISNLTITNSYTTSTYKYLGIFPRMDGGTVSDLTFDNVQLITALSGTSQMAGLIAGNVYNKKINTIKNISIINSSVQGSSTNGVGGLVGLVQDNTTVLNIENVKATNFRVFNKSASVGGLVGKISNTSTLNISDVDFQGEAYAYTTVGYSGGLIGYTNTRTIVTINRAVVEAVFQNTLVTDPLYYNKYSTRQIGGFIGYNKSALGNININHSFFTGSLFNQVYVAKPYIGTALGGKGTLITIANTFHSYVIYRDSSGNPTYIEPSSPRGQMSTLVNASSMPTKAWWDNFYDVNYDPVNDLWEQDITGRPILIR